MPLRAAGPPKSGSSNPNDFAGDNPTEFAKVCIMFRVKVVEHSTLSGSRGNVWVCKHRGSYTPVVLMIGRYEGKMDQTELRKVFYKVDHRLQDVSPYDKPLPGGLSMYEEAGFG